MLKKKLQVFICIMLSFTLLLMTGCGGAAKESSQAASGEEKSAFQAGTYTAEAQGNGGSVKVEVTFSSTKIEDIKLLSQTETTGLGDVAMNKLIEDILSGQTLAVDAISGATNSSTAILAAIEDCVKQASGDVEGLKQKTTTKTAGEAIEKSADVVIIGGGGAGLAAAVSANENGSKVILIEKTIALGGNTLRSGGGYNTYDPDRQKNVKMNDALIKELQGYVDDNASNYGDFAPTFEKLQIEIKEYLASGDTTVLFDSPELHAIQAYIGGTRTDLKGNTITPNYALVTKLTNNSLPTLKWLEDMGAEVTDAIGTILGALWPRSHALVEHTGIGFLKPLEDRAIELGTEIMFETKAEELIVENGRVVGVKATKSDGTPVTLKASKGVIMATGGFGANPEMRQKYNTYWEEMPLTMKTTNTPAATGDGINMGIQVGAKLIGMEFIQLMPSSHPETGALSGGVWGSAEDQVFVNKAGKRFINEYSERDVLAKAALQQEEQLFFIICDKNTAGNMPDGKNLWGDDVERLIETGSVYRADTLEELATQIGADKETFVNEINKYNSYIEKGNDPEFQKTNFGKKIEVAPFYATPRSPSVHHTMGGLAMDTDARVLDENNQVIPGFYAAGEVTGGIHAGNRLGGNAITDIMVFGKIAGESASQMK